MKTDFYFLKIKKNIFNRVVAIIAATVLSLTFFCSVALAEGVSYKEAAKGALEWQCDRIGASGISDMPLMLASSAGTSPAEWYTIALLKYDGSADLSPYISALEKRISESAGFSPTDSLRIALAMTAAKGKNAFAEKILKNAGGYSDVIAAAYSLILLDCAAYPNELCSRSAIIEKLLSYEIKSGGFAFSGSRGDPDVSAMVLTALSPYKNDPDVSPCFERTLNFLSSIQNGSGGFSSFGTENCESSSQVLIALSSSGIDAARDVRFLKGGRSVCDAIMSYRRSDGGFAHISDGNSDNTATVQALLALLSYNALINGEGSIYRFTGSMCERDEPKNGENESLGETSNRPSGASYPSTSYGGQDFGGDKEFSGGKVSSLDSQSFNEGEVPGTTNSDARERADGAVDNTAGSTVSRDENANGLSKNTKGNTAKTALIIISVFGIIVSFAILIYAGYYYTKISQKAGEKAAGGDGNDDGNVGDTAHSDNSKEDINNKK